MESKKKILIIEDDSLTLLVLKNLLSNRNFDIVALNEGRHYHEKMDGVETVIIDCGLPFVSGEEIAIEIKENHPSIKVVLTSVSPREKIGAKAKEIMDGFIGKPYNTEKIDQLFTLLFNK
jgi:DNA-binding NarL/FixJ family response regulator